MFLDMLLFTIIVPLLPELAREFNLSKLSTGVMTGAYAAGVLAGALPGGLLAVRWGARNVMLTGLAILSVSVLVFASARHVALLDLARLAQGWGGAWTWGGAMTWMLTMAPAHRRGTVLGSALALGTFGTLLGPTVGAIAETTSRQLVFGGIVIAIGVLTAGALRTQKPPRQRKFGALTKTLRDRRVVAGIWLVAIPPVGIGAISVLGPLRLADFGAPATVIGVTFTVAAAAQATAKVFVGPAADRYGFRPVLRMGLLGGALVATAVTLPSAVLPLSAALVGFMMVVGTLNVSTIGLLTTAVEAHGASPALSFTSVNFAWALGQVTGSVGGGGLAEQTVNALPLLALAALCLLARQLALRSPAGGTTDSSDQVPPAPGGARS